MKHLTKHKARYKRWLVHPQQNCWRLYNSVTFLADQWYNRIKDRVEQWQGPNEHTQGFVKTAKGN